MVENLRELSDKLALMSDESLLDRFEKKAEEFTPEASAAIEAEVFSRGGVDALRQRVGESRAQTRQRSAEDLAILRRFYPVIVLVTYGCFMYAVDASLWFYWLCLFALVASLFALLFRPPFNPEDELKDLSSGITETTGSPPDPGEPGAGGEAGGP